MILVFSLCEARPNEQLERYQRQHLLADVDGVVDVFC